MLVVSPATTSNGRRDLTISLLRLRLQLTNYTTPRAANCYGPIRTFREAFSLAWNQSLSVSYH